MEIGDTVRGKNRAICTYRNKGKIVKNGCVSNSKIEFFDVVFEKKNTHFHDLDGLCEQGYGYWCRKTDLEVVKKPKYVKLEKKGGIDAETVKKQYEEVRKEFKYPPTSLSLDADSNTPFYIQNGDLHICPTQLLDEKYNKSIFRHEIGHFCICPYTVEIMKQMHLRAKKGLGMNDEEYAHIVVNVVADIIVDHTNLKKLNDPLAYRVKQILKNKDVAKDIASNPIKQILIGVTNKVVGETLIPVDKKHEKTVEELYHAVIVKQTPYPSRSEEAAKILKKTIDKEAKKQQTEQQKALEQIKYQLYQAIEDFGEEMGTTGQTLVEVNQESKDNLAQDSETEEEYIKHLKQIGIGCDDCNKQFIKETINYYRNKAVKNIKFKVKVKGEEGGKIVKGGLVDWNAEDKIEDLDIEETVGNSGLLIPNVTTLQYDTYVGVTEESENMPKVQILYDVSGSMPQQTALITIFSLIESCRANYIPISIVTFSRGVEYSQGFNHEYSQAEEKIYETYRGGATYMLEGVEECKRILKNEKDALVIIVSDYETHNYRETIEGILEIGKKHKLCPIKFGRGTEGKELNPIEINKLEDLYTLVVEEFNKFIEGI